MATPRFSPRLLAPTLLACLLAACGQAPLAEEAPRPVLVARAADMADPGAAAFAGEVHASQESPLSFRIPGNLVRRHVDAGQAVRRGDLLAELDPGDQRLQAQAAQAQLRSAEAELGRARAERERYRALAGSQLVSQSALDAQEVAWKAAAEQARAARAELDVARNQAAYSQLRAPRDGVIATRQAEAGQVVAAGQTVFTLAGDAGREVAIALPEISIRSFRLGQPARIELWNAPGSQLSGRIREIAAAADPQTRTYAARVAIEGDAAGEVALGQSARVFLREDAAAAVSVPLSAVQRGAGGDAAVWVVDPATRALRSVPVRLGAFGATRVPVLSGLDPDALVVVAGGHLLREGQTVAPVDRDNRPVAPQAPDPEAGPSRR